MGRPLWLGAGAVSVVSVQTAPDAELLATLVTAERLPLLLLQRGRRRARVHQRILVHDRSQITTDGRATQSTVRQTVHWPAVMGANGWTSASECVQNGASVHGVAVGSALKMGKLI